MALASSVNRLKSLFPTHQVYGRTKTLASALDKLTRKPEHYRKVSDLTDGSGMRVVGKTVQDVADAVAQIEATFKVVESTSYMGGHPDNKAYRSHHLLVQSAEGETQEVQVRTEGEDRWGDWYHDAYKPRSPEQKAFLVANKKLVDDYGNAISAHFFERESGRPSKKPDCPDAVRQTFGCL